MCTFCAILQSFIFDPKKASLEPEFAQKRRKNPTRYYIDALVHTKKWLFRLFVQHSRECNIRNSIKKREKLRAPSPTGAL